jgi:hypothetical protein
LICVAKKNRGFLRGFFLDSNPEALSSIDPFGDWVLGVSLFLKTTKARE